MLLTEASVMMVAPTESHGKDSTDIDLLISKLDFSFHVVSITIQESHMPMFESHTG